MFYIILEDGGIERFRNREDAEEKKDHCGGRGEILNHFPKEAEYFQIMDVLMDAHFEEIRQLQASLRKG